MVKNNKKHILLTKRFKIIIILSVLILTVAGTGWKVWYVDSFNYTKELTTMASVRELIIQAARQTKTDAVRDPKTGDIYFPEVKLFLPYQNVGELTYNAVPNAASLSVSNKAIFNQMAAKLYTSDRQEKMFKEVPHLQACQRGVNVLRAPIADAELSSNDLIGVKKLSDSESLHIYLDKGCPELKTTAEALKNLRTY